MKLVEFLEAHASVDDPARVTVELVYDITKRAYWQRWDLWIGTTLVGRLILDGADDLSIVELRPDRNAPWGLAREVLSELPVRDA